MAIGPVKPDLCAHRAVFSPYKIGAGFVALDAFNLGSSGTGRDLGVVILGSVCPTRREAKFTFPLYLRGGFLLGTQKWFYMVGPGTGVRLYMQELLGIIFQF